MHYNPGCSSFTGAVIAFDQAHPSQKRAWVGHPAPARFSMMDVPQGEQEGLPLERINHSDVRNPEALIRDRFKFNSPDKASRGVPLLVSIFVANNEFCLSNPRFAKQDGKLRKG